MAPALSRSARGLCSMRGARRQRFPPLREDEISVAKRRAQCRSERTKWSGGPSCESAPAPIARDATTSRRREERLSARPSRPGGRRDRAGPTAPAGRSAPRSPCACAASILGSAAQVRKVTTSWASWADGRLGAVGIGHRAIDQRRRHGDVPAREIGIEIFARRHLEARGRRLAEAGQDRIDILRRRPRAP